MKYFIETIQLGKCDTYVMYLIITSKCFFEHLLLKSSWKTKQLTYTVHCIIAIKYYVEIKKNERMHLKWAPTGERLIYMGIKIKVRRPL